MHSCNTSKTIVNRVPVILVLVFLFISCAARPVGAENASPYTGRFEYIAYSYVVGIGDAPVNSIEHFQHCSSGEYFYSMLKGDLQLTADNRIIMCHDDGFTLNSKGRIIDYEPSDNVKIRSMTYAQCLNLRYEARYNGEYARVCGFEQFMAICAKNNKKAYITIRNENADELTKQMMSVLEKYGMLHDCIINSGSLSALMKVREANTYIRLSLVVSKGTLEKSTIDEASDLGNCILTFFNFPSSRFGGIESLEEYTEEILYAQEKGIDLHVAVLEDATLVDRLKRMGISGAQMKVDTKKPANIPCGTVRITSVKNRTATLVKARNIKEVVIPPTAKIEGMTCRITTIEADAFTGGNIRKVVLGRNIEKIKRSAFRRSEARMIEIRTRRLKKASVRGAFRGSKLKYARIRTGSRKSRKIYAAKYKFILRSRISGRNLKMRY